jgi:hypothetical protein
MTTYAGCFDSDEMAQATLGHELTHRVQYNYDTSTSAPVQTKFLKEGTARASEDNWFTNIDHRPDALTAPFSFNLQVNEYFASANNDITSYGMRYNACLWWKYASEQYGTPSTEPERGVDFFHEVYNQNTAGYNGIAAVNHALSSVGAGIDFDGSFKKFAAANWAKDLSGAPDGSYNYIDEDETDSPAPYGPLTPANGGTIDTGTSAVWNNQWVDRYGLRYYTALVGSPCPVVSASVHRDNTGPAFYHIITQDNSAYHNHVQGSGADWTQAFMNDGISQITAIVGSLDNSSQVDVTLACADPFVDIIIPNDGAVAHVSPADHFLAQVLVTNGSPTGPVVSGLTNADFSAEVGGSSATVVNGGFIQEQYWLVLQAPSLSDGTYDLTVSLVGSGASDTNTNSVVYDPSKADQVLVIDRSGSMGVDGGVKMSAAQDAANFYADVSHDSDGLAVVPYNEDVNPAPFDMRVVTGTVRDDAKAFINALSASGWTSIGDGLNNAVDQRTITSTTGNPRCSFVLLSDGIQNRSLYWADVMTDVKDTGCPVTSIAFGPASDETLMQDIATETGGAYFYNDVYVSTSMVAGVAASTTPGDMSLDLGSIYEYAQARGEGRQRLLSEKGLLSRKTTSATHKVLVDETISEVVFALDWYEQYWAELELKLRQPDGTIIDHQKVLSYTFEDETSKHVGWRISRPEPGPWEMIVELIGNEEAEIPYQVFASGHTGISLNLLLPDRLGSRYVTGNRVPIYAFLSSEKPIPGAEVEAWVSAPDGTETHFWLFDDGEHGDGGARDGFYAGLYTLVNQAEVVYPSEDEEHDPRNEGGYRVRARATHEEMEFQREALGGFSVLEGADENQNRLPDTFEEEYGLTSAEGDPDNDGLNNYQEYQNGTDPRNSDTDGGGENDGSEVNNGRDPLDPDDDAIKRPDFLELLPWYKGIIRFVYDVKPTYKAMWLRRITLGPMAQSGASIAAQTAMTIPLTGAYTDTTVMSDTAYLYQMWAEGEGGEESGILSSETVTPTEDPVPPEALVIVNGGASSTEDVTVTLSFVPYELEGEDAENFDDIAAVLLSNDPTFTGASWQAVGDPETYTTTWQLDAGPGEVARVYAHFRDEAENESVGAKVGMILYRPNPIYLPLVLRSS